MKTRRYFSWMAFAILLSFLSWPRVINSELWQATAPKLGIVTARAEVLDMYERVHLGSSKEKVLSTYTECNYKKLTAIKARYGDTLLVYTPNTLDAKNWHLWLQFNENQKLVGIYIRFSDSMSWKPAMSPDDKLLDGNEVLPELKPFNER